MPVPLPPVYGENINSLGGNTRIPEGYVGDLHNCEAAHGLVDRLDSTVKMVRTFVWPTVPAKDDPADALAWVHAPLLDYEVQGLACYLTGFPVKSELAIGALWQMLYKNSAMPPEYQLSAAEIANRLKAVAKQLLALKPDRMDAYNEAMLELGQQEVLRVYWPAVRAAAAAADVPLTISVIFDVDDPTSARAIGALRWLTANGGLPDLVEIHANGWTASGFVRAMPRAIAELRDAFPGIRLGMGECDVEWTAAVKAVTDSLGLIYFLRWQK